MASVSDPSGEAANLTAEAANRHADSADYTDYTLKSEHP